MSGDFAGVARLAAHAAAVRLGWRPAEFWAATPAELLTSLGRDQPAPDQPGDAGLLARMMEQFPDAEFSGG